jgi:N-acetylneuraminic acid mutarotase
MSIEIKYKGETVTSIEGGQTATLHLKDSKLTDDLIVEAGASSGSGGGAEYNIAYGDTEPTDTSKLWIKTNEPEALQVKLNANVVGSEDMMLAVGTLPKAAQGIASATIGTKVYLFGGYGSDNLNTINVFDTETNTIQTLSAKLPIATSGMSAAVVGTKVYLFGSRNGGASTIDVVDTETNTIQTSQSILPVAVHTITSAVVGNKIYLFGGQVSSTYYNTIHIFYPETNSLQTLSTTLPKAMSEMASAVIGTKIYLFGGCDSSTAYSHINVFDTETNTIQTLDKFLPKAAQGIASATIGTKVYLFGGYNSVSGKFSTVNVFNTETNTIQTLSATLPIGTYRMASATIGTKVYLFGGSGGSTLNTINMFTALAELATNNMLIEASNGKNFFNLLPNLEIGINNVYLGNADGYGERVKAALYTNGAWAEI